jgi:transposase-like protein
LGFISRINGNIILVDIPYKSSQSILPLITKNVKPGSTIYTDKMATYVNSRSKSNLEQYNYKHYWTNHKQFFVDRLDNHTNTIERLWTLRNSISHIRRTVQAKDILYELSLFKFRHNILLELYLEMFLYYSAVFYNNGQKYEY